MLSQYIIEIIIVLWCGVLSVWLMRRLYKADRPMKPEELSDEEVDSFLKNPMNFRR